MDKVISRAEACVFPNGKGFVLVYGTRANKQRWDVIAVWYAAELKELAEARMTGPDNWYTIYSEYAAKHGQPSWPGCTIRHNKDKTKIKIGLKK